MIKWLPALLIFLALLNPEPTSAHAFGQLYNLPVPFWLYLYGGAAAIIISFLIIGYFLNQPSQSIQYPNLRLTKFEIFQKPAFVITLKTLSIFLFILTICTGLFGENNPGSNFNMTFFWIIFMLGFTYITALIGNIWSQVNPLKIIVELLETLFKKKMDGIFANPKKFAYYPAFCIYFLFVWLELFGGTTPRSLSLIILEYSIITLWGTLLFGKNAWFKFAEFFSVAFRLIGKIAPVERKNNNFYLRPPFVGLLKEKAEHFSLVIFIIFMLSSTAFDGFRSTLPWHRLAADLIEPIVNFFLENNSHAAAQVIGTIGLILTLFVFLYVYITLTALTKYLTKSELPLKELILKFALSLVPIALVYNIAHYYTLIQTEGQNIIKLASDPFGVGWNLFGTASFQTNYSVINANFAWHSQVAVILIGHIAAVYLAHIIALDIFPSHKKALVSQIPMLILMVIYTMAGLWILSQPITNG